MCLQNPELYSTTNGRIFTLDVPEQIQNLTAIPCNVCDRETALDSIERKHYSHGTWKPLARDYFMHTHRKKPKSDFIKFEEATGLVTAHEKELNTVYAKDELLTSSELSKIGFRIQDDRVVSNYSPEDSSEILITIIEAIQNEKTTTRHNRGDLLAGITEQNPKLGSRVHGFSDAAPVFIVPRVAEPKKTITPRRTQATTSSDELFGGKLILQSGAVNDLYRGITNIYDSQRKDPEKLRLVFPILCFSFRLILEVAAKELYGATANKPFSALINQAKIDFRQNGRNTELSDLSVNTPWFNEDTKLEAVLHNYAHNNLTIGIGDVLKYSNIVGQILMRYFGRNNS
jgi:hypothetical protein